MDLPLHQLSMTVLMTPDTANFSGNVHGGSSSMEIGIKVIAEEIRNRVVRHVNSCFFTMIAVDDDKKPTLVTPLKPVTADECRRHAAAELRKQMRREMEHRFALIRATP